MCKKTALITGASKGIGLATAKLFAQQGWNLVLHHHNTKDSIIQLEKEYGDKILTVCGDIAQPQEVENLFKQAMNRFGVLDAVINNAGISQQKLFTELTGEEIDTMINTNLKSVILCCQQAVRSMLQEHRGTIINVSSIYGIDGGSCEVHYSATKAGVIGLTKALAKEVALSGIRVNCVAPGAIDTPMNAHLDDETLKIIQQEIPMGRLGTPHEVAQVIYFLCGEGSSYLTGQVISPNGGILM